MNLKILFVLIIYYSFISLIFVMGSSVFNEESDYNSTIALNESALADTSDATPGIFATLASFGRFFAFITFGLFFPTSVPSWFSIFYFVWQTGLTIFTVGFLLSSLHNG